MGKKSIGDEEMLDFGKATSMGQQIGKERVMNYFFSTKNSERHSERRIRRMCGAVDNVECKCMLPF